MNAKTYLQQVKTTRIIAPISVTATTATATQWDTKGLHSREVLFQFGAIGAAGITALSVHASDTTGFTPGAGNRIAQFTGDDLPANADDNLAWRVSIPENAGRFVNVIVTVGANASLVSAIGIGLPEEGPITAGDRGVKKYATVTGDVI